MTITDSRTSEDVRLEARAWFEANWDPELTLDQWWERFGLSGWAFPTWPERAFGKGLDSQSARAVAEERTRIGAYGAPSGIGPMMAGPTIAEHGSAEQVERFLPDLVCGRKIWCQLFSEPGSGSDLASIQSWAERDGDEWIVNGQKVWTSGAQYSRYGILIARTNRDVPKHEGITYFVLDLEQPGVEVRPLREMTGGATFNEVFINDARIPDADRIGDVDRGWAIAVTTLSHERKNLGAGGLGAMAGGAMLGIGIGGEDGPALPDPDARVGDLVGGDGAGFSMGGDMVRMLPMLFGKQGDPLVRQDIARLYTMMEISRYTTLRSRAAAERGDAPGPEQSTGKLMVSHLMRFMRDFMLRLEGPAGTLVGPDAPMGGMAQWMALFSPAISIAGGTDEIQRNIIGERVLGLPPESRVDKELPFRELRVGTPGGERTVTMVDLLDPRFYADIDGMHDGLRALRAEGPVWRDEANELWAVLGHAQVVEVERQAEVFSSEEGYRSIVQPKGMERDMIALDDPDHAAQRSLVSRRFTPRAVRSLEPLLRATVAELVDDVADRGEMEVVGDLAAPLPARLTAHLIGFPEEHAPSLRTWSERLMRIDGMAKDPDVVTGFMGAIMEFSEVVGPLVEQRRLEPADDLLSVWANAELDGCPIGQEVIVQETGLFISGGAETTRTVIARGLVELAAHPEMWEAMAADPGLVPTAVEELVRWVTPLNNFFRTATTGASIGDVKIDAGDRVVLVYPSANRDERVFDDPYTFDIGRNPNPHVAFGFGTHFCLGASLARLELRVLLEELTSRLTALEVRVAPDIEPNVFVGAVRSCTLGFERR